MPLTIAHPAATPLLRLLIRRWSSRIPLSALVIGTMVPDFEYLARLHPGGGFGHTAPGFLLFCLPVGVLSWIVFRWVIAPALVALMPPGLGAAAAAHTAPGSIRRLLPGAVMAVALGAASHDVWDSFTHQTGWMVTRIPQLNRPVTLGPLPTMPWFEALQYCSSVVGVVLVALWAAHWVAAQPREVRAVPAGQLAWRLRELGVLLIVAAVGAVANGSRKTDDSLSGTVGLAAVGAMAALALALCCYGVIHLRRQGRSG